MLFYQLCVCLVVGLISVSQKSEAACDKKIVDRIQSLWKQSGTPNNILPNNIKNSPDLLVYTTKNYLKDESTVVCNQTFWEKDSNGAQWAKLRSVTLRKNNVADNGLPKSVIEQTGRTCIPDDNRLAYQIPTSSDKVSAFYSCTDDDAKLTAPEGVVKVNKGYSKDALESAKTQLEWALGRKLESKFADSCGSTKF